MSYIGCGCIPRSVVPYLNSFTAWFICVYEKAWAAVCRGLNLEPHSDLIPLQIIRLPFKYTQIQIHQISKCYGDLIDVIHSVQFILGVWIPVSGYLWEDTCGWIPVGICGYME